MSLIQEALPIICSGVREVMEWNVDGTFNTREKCDGVTPGWVGIDDDDGACFGYTLKER